MNRSNHTSRDYIDDREHVFIVGSGRSGTTLLASILFASGAYAVYRAETKLLDECPPKYGSLASSSAYRRFREDWLNSRQFHRSGLTGEEFDKAVADHRNNYLQMLSAFMDAVAARQNKKLWIEDTPSNAFRLKEISRAFPNSRVIHIVRDGRAVALSLAKLGWTGVHTHSKRKGLCYSALKWEQTVQTIIKTRHNLHDRYHEIIYEDLVTNPSVVLAELGNFLGINLAVDGIIGSGKVDSMQVESQSALTSPNTAFSDVGPGISSKPAYRWRELISPEDEALLNNYIGKTLQYYNYPVTFSDELGLSGFMIKVARTWFLRGKRILKYYTILGRITPSPLEIGQK